MTHVTDTHSMIWYLRADPRFREPARQALADPNASIVIPSIVLAEVAFLHARGRIAVDLPSLLTHVDRTANCYVYPFNEAVARLLPIGLEIHDAMIVATALLLKQAMGQQVALITRDQEITASGLVPVIW
jgi:PIN domain nuclease of toxin-antitoxin system